MNLLKLARMADKKLQRWRDAARRRVLINARRPMNYSIVAPVVEAIREDPRVRFYLVASEESERAPDIYRDARPGLEIITALKASSMRFDAYLVSDLLWLALPRGACRILMFHGVAGKYNRVYDSPHRSMREWDRLFFINERRLKNFIGAKAIDRDSGAARLVGMPKVDCLVNGTLERSEILRKLGLDPSRPSVLYAPTWSASSSLNVMGEEIVRQLGKAGYIVMVKLHDGSLMPGRFFSGGVDWRARLRPILERTGGHLASSSDSCPYMVAADALVTDHSSVGFEYLLLDRPVIRIHMDELIENTDVNRVYVDIMSRASSTIMRADQIVAAVESSLSDPASGSHERKRAAAELFYKPGTATSRAVSELYNAIELQLPEFMSTRLCGPKTELLAAN